MAIEKELVPGTTAKVDEQGMLTLLTISEESTQQFQLSAKATRALLNMLRRKETRIKIGYRLWQKKGN